MTLYCTDEVVNVPKGVEVRSASEIMDINSLRVKETSPSFWSNVFRYKMIQKTGAVWIDCDAFCHVPFPEEDEWIFAGHGMRGALNCGVVAIHAQSELMDALLDYYDNLPDYPAWWNKKQRQAMDALPKDMPHATKIYKAERTSFGPQAFTHYVKATDNMHRVRPPSALYPVPFQLVDVFFDPYGSVEGWIREDTLSVHLYTNGVKPYWQNNPPLPNSYVARMCVEVGIDPEASLRGGDFDIEPAGPQSTHSAAASVTVPAPNTEPLLDAETSNRISELEGELKKSNQKARRKVMNARTDGFLDGVCGQLRQGDLAIDLRAHIGDVSAKLLETGADVIAFDPDPWAAEKIQERLGDNERFTFHAAAVGLQQAQIKLYRTVNLDETGKTVSVKSTTLPGDQKTSEDGQDLLEVVQINFIEFVTKIIAERGEISFLKMDIEGGELELLEKMDALNLFENIRCTVVKTYENRFKELRPRYRSLRADFAKRYGPSHVNLDWK